MPSPRRKLSDEQELELVARFQEGERRSHLGKAFGISSNTVLAILQRRRIVATRAQVHSIYKPTQRAKAKSSAALPVAPGLFQSDAAARARLMAGR